MLGRTEKETRLVSPTTPRNEKSIVAEYDIKEVVGKGQYGVCHRAIRRSDGAEVAIKSISRSKLLTRQDLEEVDREIAIMRHLAGHPNIVQIFEVYEDTSYIHLVQELCKGGELFDQIISKGHYSEKEAAGMVRTILAVIKHMHDLGVVHRDLKPENFLFASKVGTADTDSSLKAIDFGLSCFFSKDNPLKDCVGSSYYIAPEVLRRSYDKKADIWSAGVILYILLCGSPPFFGSCDRDILHKVMRYRDGTLNFKFQPWPEISEGAKECVTMMLKLDPKERASIRTVLEHPWMKENGSASARPISNEVVNRLSRFVKMSKLQKLISRMMAEMLSPAEIKGLHTIFQRLDSDNDGVVTMDELRAGLVKWGVKNGELENHVAQMMKNMDMDGSGTIDLDEFMSATMSMCQFEHEGNMLQAFMNIDKDRNGVISREELGKALTDYGLVDTQDSIDEILDEVDTNRDGLIDYQEFVANLSEVKMFRVATFDLKMSGRSFWSGSETLSSRDFGGNRSRRVSKTIRDWDSSKDMDVDSD
ncbi:calcium-dependent protein kinase [Chloropicon primus]|uniref:Calcium-dependent protein kinase n=1 Tax=Chloropicon primus TaxID=1764295 RepID=A0A5B8MJB9_9CHLO|nr:calcium-dependent protein kinase [Chloropicon primus]UPQ98700.1 calcium-dependent protein kinase [Chloropicon primus]|eukprot:QDZ19490.1 calcium-dependent protein kinase [Chloropicon primus]